MRRIKILFTAGRLGNQLFQLAGLHALIEDRHIGFLCGGADLSKVFDWSHRRLHIVRGRYKRVQKAFALLGSLGVIGSYGERKLNTAYGLVNTGELSKSGDGFLPIDVFQNVFLQSDKWLNKTFLNLLKFRQEVAAKVAAFAGDQHINWETTIFVHIRRGDYLRWKVLGVTDLSLPSSYYRSGIEHLRSSLNVERILFVTDEPAYVRVEFQDLDPQIISSKDAAFDMAVMAKCISGVLSPSSFSWWGYMLGERSAEAVVPTHWLGFQRGITVPSAIMSDRFVQIDPSV